MFDFCKYPHIFGGFILKKLNKNVCIVFTHLFVESLAQPIVLLYGFYVTVKPFCGALCA